MFLKELETYNDLDALKEKAEEKKKVSCCLDVVMVCCLDVVMVCSLDVVMVCCLDVVMVCCLDVVMVCNLDVVMVSCSRWKMVKTSFIFYCIRVLALNVSVSNSYLF